MRFDRRNFGRRSWITAILVSLAGSAPAAERGGCDRYPWPIDRQRAALAQAELARVSSGSERQIGPDPFELRLAPFPDADLPMPPERSRDASARRAGYVRFGAPPAASLIQVALSLGPWVDIVQEGRYVAPIGFHGVEDCEGVRKVMRFNVSASAFVLQISGVPDTVQIRVVLDRIDRD